MGELLENAQDHRKKVEASAWKLPFKVRQHDVKLRDCLKQVVKALKLFQDVGTAIASLDRIHAGIPWVAVNVVLEESIDLPQRVPAFDILKIILNENEEYKDALQAVSELSTLIAKYHRVESIYFDNPEEQIEPNFEQLLIDLYVEVLTLETQIVRHFRKNWFGQLKVYS